MFNKTLPYETFTIVNLNLICHKFADMKFLLLRFFFSLQRDLSYRALRAH